MRKTKSSLPKAIVTFDVNDKTKIKIDMVQFCRKKLQGSPLTANENKDGNNYLEQELITFHINTVQP